MYNRNIIGMDIDNVEYGKKLLRTLRILKTKGVYRLSSSKKGYHFRLKVIKHSKEENLLIRYMFGDCYGRFMSDVRRLKAGIRHLDILFDKKEGKKSGKWRKI